MSLCLWHRSYESKQSLSRHIETVHEGKKIKCKICNRAFTQLGTLKTHEMKCELKAKIDSQGSVVCEICKNSFTCPKNLKSHSRAFHDCNLCGKSFPRKALFSHKNNFHNGNFSCHLCNYAFKNLVLLEVHIGKMHNT